MNYVETQIQSYVRRIENIRGNKPENKFLFSETLSVNSYLCKPVCKVFPFARRDETKMRAARVCDYRAA
jgi:hypothetical protein